MHAVSMYIIYEYIYLLVAPSSVTSAICPNVTNGKKHVMIADKKTDNIWRDENHDITITDHYG